MADVFALDVSMGKSYCVWYRDHHCLKEFELPHTNEGFSKLLGIIKQSQNPTVYFEATGVYSRVVDGQKLLCLVSRPPLFKRV